MLQKSLYFFVLYPCYFFASCCSNTVYFAALWVDRKPEGSRFNLAPINVIDRHVSQASIPEQATDPFTSLIVSHQEVRVSAKVKVYSSP